MATEKQIAWAEKIKADRIATVNAIADGKIRIEDWWITSHASGATPLLDVDAVVEMIGAMDPVTLIETINRPTADLYAAHIGFQFPVWVANPNYDENDPFGMECPGEWVSK